MRFGANTFIWESPFETRHARDVTRKLKAMGFDTVEIAWEDPARIDAEQVGAAVEAAGLRPIVCGAFGPGRDVSSDDEAIRKGGMQYIRQLIDGAVAIGADLVCGPMYSQTGKARLLPAEERAAERLRAVWALMELADYAGERGVRLALEPLNRFETDMLNTTEQALQFVHEVGRTNVGLHLDTFHMHLEEKDSGRAIRQAGERVFHFHACENDRGVPGTGQVAWGEIARALHDIGYRGDVVIESFTPKVRTIAQAVSLWRSIAPDQDSIAREGLAFLKELFGSAGSANGGGT